MCFMIFLVGIIRFILPQIKFLNAELIDKCNSPWKDYCVRGTQSGVADMNLCHKKCDGYAFYTNESKLICFKDKFYATPLPKKYIEDWNSDLCYCGYPKSSSTVVVQEGERIKRKVTNWLKCDPIRREYKINKAHRGCKEECSGLAIYFYKRRVKSYLLYCEEEKRKDFYNVVGFIGNLKEYKANDGSSKVSKYRLCTCGIENKAIVKLNKIISSTDMVSDSFKECVAPWTTPKVRLIKMESCLKYCNKYCGKAKGVHHDGVTHCFHKERETKMKAIRTKMVDEGCECGYKKNSFEEVSSHILSYPKNASQTFVSCDPKITSNTRSRIECIQFCAESRAYITLRNNKPLKIHCIYKPDVEKLKSQRLIGKCEKEINQNKGNSQREYMLTCKCGLGKCLKINNTENKFHSANEPKNENAVLEIPPSWATRKKRSVVNRDKKSFNLK